MQIVRKAAAKADGFEYVLSDDSVDRYGDVIEQDGWVLTAFKKNPIALFGHDGQFPVGAWKNIRVEGGKLMARLEMAAEGTSERLNEIIRLVQQGILRAVSVGFRPIESTDIDTGIRFIKQELVEASLVSVPANANALQVAKSLNVSRDTMNIVFGEHAEKGDRIVRRGSAGEHAASPRVRHTIMNIEQRIADAQERLVKLRDQLTEHLKTVDDENPTDEQTTVTDELNGRIEGAQKALDSLKRSEQTLAANSERAGGGGGVTVNGQRPFAIPAKKVDPREYVMRSLVAMVVSRASGGMISQQQALIQRYGDDGKVDDATRTVFDSLVQKAATAPATTGTSGWASQLVQTVIADFMESLMPASIYPGLSARGLRLTFGRNGIVSIPSRSATPTIAGSFVAEGAPIPVRQGAFTATTLTPKKMAVISTFTREIAQHSTPAIEGLIRDAIREDTSVALDTVLLDATVASAIRPAGIRAGVSVTTAEAGGGFAALVEDIKALVGALVTSTNGNLRAPVWLMNPIQALAISLTQNAGGDFPFAQEINQGRFQGYPLIQSSTVTAAMVLLVDAADFVSVTGDEPQFDVSDQATLHMEDTTPLAIGTAGSPATVAAPVRSLWQTDTIGIRMILPMNWAFRRAGNVAWTQSVTW